MDKKVLKKDYEDLRKRIIKRLKAITIAIEKEMYEEAAFYFEYCPTNKSPSNQLSISGHHYIDCTGMISPEQESDVYDVLVELQVKKNFLKEELNSYLFKDGITN